MKLFEVEEPSDNLVLLLRNMVSQADSQNQPSFLSWGALANLMQNLDGPGVNYDTFKSMYDANPDMFKTIVNNFDARGVTLKTKAKDPKQQGPGQGEKHIAQMAKAATARRQG
jgi:hypothetical protein